MPRLRNPISGTVDDFTQGQAKVRRRNGWVDADPPRESRADLDAHAASLGLDPDDYRTKAEVAQAINEAV